MTTSVLHVTQPVDGGVGGYVAELARTERRAGLSVAVAAPDGALADRLTGDHVPWLQWEAARAPGPSVGAEARALAALIGEVSPDVVHLHSSKAGLVGRLVLRGRTPTIFQPHGWAWQAQGLAARLSAGWERWAVRWTTALVCVSGAELEAGRERGVVATRSEVVPNGVDLARFRPAGDAARSAARIELGLPAAAGVVVCVGRLNEQKGQEVLVGAWSAVRASAPGALLVLLGSGPARDRLERLARSSGVADSVLMPGEDRRIERWYAAADVVALASRWGEAMALTPLEAMASARPVVASDVAGVRESVAAGCGAVVSAGDAHGFARELLRRLTDPTLAREEGLQARRHVEQHHDLGATHAALLDLTLELRRTGEGRGQVTRT